MRNHAISITIIAAIVFTNALLANEVLKPMSERDLSFNDPGPSDGFLKSWHAGEEYLTKAEYIFDGKLVVKVNEKQPNWFLRTFAEWTTKAVDAIERGRFTGKAVATTLVYHEDPNLCLLRDYKYVYGTGVWSGEVAPSNKMLRDALATANRMGKIIPMQNVVGAGIDWIVSAYNPTLTGWGHALSDISIEWARANVGELNEDGAIAFGPNSLVGKAMDGKEASKVLNAAMQFSEDICGKKMALGYSGESRKAVEVRNVSQDGIDPRKSAVDFRRMMSQCTPLKEGEPLDAIIRREAAMPTHKLFDGAVRRPGDKWLVDASLFSTFLHPDLKGCFTGSAVVSYIEDQTGENGYYSDEMQRITEKEKRYDVRKLEVIPSAKINGKMETTDFEYDETPKGGRFRASYDPNSKIEIFVDKESGHIVYADILIKARDVDALPSIPLMRGFKGNGDASLEIKFYGDIVPMASKSH